MSTDFDVAQLLALPMQACIRVQIGPQQTVEVSQAAWNAQKDAFQEWALGIPNIGQGITYRQIKPYTGGNGMLAKLTVALGDLAGIWTMYPSRHSSAALWHRDSPSIQPRATKKSKRRVPKPSAGDLDTNKNCTCCSRPMGPSDSQVHDLVESDETPNICLECDLECGPGARTCEINRSGKKKTASVQGPSRTEVEEDPMNFGGDMSSFEEYARQFLS